MKILKSSAISGLIFLFSFISARLIEGIGPFFDGSFLFFCFLFFITLIRFIALNKVDLKNNILDLILFPFYLLVIFFLWWWLRHWDLLFLIIGIAGFFLWLHHVTYRLLEKNPTH